MADWTDLVVLTLNAAGFLQNQSVVNMASVA